MTLLKFIWTFKGSTVGQTNHKKKKTKKKTQSWRTYTTRCQEFGRHNSQREQNTEPRKSLRAVDTFCQLI